MEYNCLRCNVVMKEVSNLMIVSGDGHHSTRLAVVGDFQGNGDIGSIKIKYMNYICPECGYVETHVNPKILRYTQ